MLSNKAPRTALREKCPYSEIFWSVFSRIWTEYREIRSIFPYSIQIPENKDQKKSEYEHFSRRIDSCTIPTDLCNEMQISFFFAHD